MSKNAKNEELITIQYAVKPAIEQEKQFNNYINPFFRNLLRIALSLTPNCLETCK